ncbi:MAG: DNA methyltransferase [Cyanobacteria bacterium J06648_11]
MTDAERIQAFVDYASSLDGDEKGEAQVFCDRLFIGFGHDGYKEAGATLEQRVKNQKGTTSFADLMWSPRLLLEMKRRGEKLQRHYQQAFEYWLNAVPNRPRYVVLCNFDEFWVYDFDLQLNDPIDVIGLNELPERFTALNFLFPDERRPLFGNDRVAVTREAANKVAKVFNAIVERGEDREATQRFILQCVTAMFAEDIDLLPRGMFAQILQDCIEGGSAYDLIGGLFRQMNDKAPAKGGRYQGVPYFNGGLFEKVEPFDLLPEELQLLREATDENWSKVQPPVFGTLFQDSMDKAEQHAHGAHFTNEADIQRVVTPTIVRPWRERIQAATSLKQLLALREELSNFHVLDPACGSGNFLYVAYRELKHIEFELLARIHEDFKTGWEKVKSGSVVSLHQFHGMDIIPFAVELAKLTLTIGKKLAIDEAKESLDAAQMEIDLEKGFERILPLENLDEQIRCCDALFSEWPDASAIIGNPPFQSKNKMHQEFGHEYVAQVREKFADVPGRVDYCVYWFRMAHNHLADGDRAGLVGTNTIRQNYSREGGLDYILSNKGMITEAVSTQEWSGDAVVHVSIANWIKGEQEGKKRLFYQHPDRPGKPWEAFELDFISSALSPLFDVTSAKALAANKTSKVCFQGQTHGHSAFLLSENEAKQIRDDPASSKCIHPYLIGDDILGEPGGKPSRFSIDLNHCADLPSAMSHAAALERIRELALPDLEAKAAEERDKTGKDKGPRQSHLQRWWKFWRGRTQMLDALASNDRYIACARVTKRPIFVFVDSSIHPNDALQVFSLHDDYSFGILQSSVHWEWFRARCSTLKSDPRYTPNTVFDSFPWPQSPTKEQVRRIADAAIRIRECRTEQQETHGWNLRKLYTVFELPGENPLKDEHDDLDEAVLDAYDIRDKADVLQSIFELNASLFARQESKDVAVGPGLAALGTQFAESIGDYITDDRIKP